LSRRPLILNKLAVFGPHLPYNKRETEKGDEVMDVLRAPWRMEYINSESTGAKGGKPKSCIFCDYAAESNDAENLIIARSKKVFIILNRYPYSNGHLMVVPFRHTSEFGSLDEAEKLDLMTMAQRAISVLKESINPDGFNLGVNLGRVAGAGIDTHLHLHIGPRWSGDTNFMSVTAETKVLPEALSVTRERLAQTWKRLFS
jgi:ATP adenylyltransferase